MRRAATRSPGRATRSATGQSTTGRCSSGAASRSGSRRRRSRPGTRPGGLVRGVGHATTRTWRSRPDTCCAWPLVVRGGKPKVSALTHDAAGVSVGVPDHTTFSRRSPGLALATALARAQASGPVHVVIDATGLKVYGAGEWLVEKHGARGKRTWRKLHLAIDPSTGEILASELTSNEEGDASQVSPLLEQIPGPLASVTADGAYDGEPVYRAVAERQPDPPVAVIIPPRAPATLSAAAGA